MEIPRGALELLENIRKERDELNTLIAGLEKRLGIAPAQAANDPTPVTPRVTVTVDSIPVGFFHNLSQTAAAEKLLRLNPGQPLATGEILDAFRKSGLQVNPKNAPTILYTMLGRNPKFVRLAKKAWGLAEWYPEKRSKKTDDEKETASE
jgi:hypothetical protein